MVWFWSDYDGTGQYGNSHALFGGKFVNYWAIIGGSGDTYGVEAETDGTPKKQLDVSRLQELGWRSKISLMDGLNTTVLSFRRELAHK